MKIGRKMALIITTLVIGLLASCASTGWGGGYMPLAEGEKVLGNVETTFVFHGQTAVQVSSGEYDTRTKAYEELLEVAQRQYLSSGLVIDIRDIVVEVGNLMDGPNVECRAYGKVIEAHR
ncbi:hypothetical protein FACS189483_04260 [Spirochaetia bacterium]|nr:hypothetical protein FACS189483_04260 [Spirochaetia bacterium]